MKPFCTQENSEFLKDVCRDIEKLVHQCHRDSDLCAQNNLFDVQAVLTETGTNPTVIIQIRYKLI